MEQEEKKPTTLTGVDLSQTASLLLPWTHDPWGKLRPPLSEEALCMSAELASAAYGMAIEPWVEAGWRDVTIQVDGELTALPPNNPLSAEWRKYWVRARLKPVSALGQMLGALRLSSSNNTTGKAVVMLHPALDGRYVVAVGFMGTGSRFYDWFSNFRMTTQDGMHRGFLELARQFEANEEKISFPETAEELGLEKLTLREHAQPEQPLRPLGLRAQPGRGNDAGVRAPEDERNGHLRAQPHRLRLRVPHGDGGQSGSRPIRLSAV